MSLKDKRILVTGVSSGIGQAVAEYLTRESANVLGLDRNTPSRFSMLAHFQSIDLSDPAAIDTAFKKLEGDFDGLADVAGASSATPTRRSSE